VGVVPAVASARPERRSAAAARPKAWGPCWAEKAAEVQKGTVRRAGRRQGPGLKARPVQLGGWVPAELARPGSLGARRVAQGPGIKSKKVRE